MIQNTVSLFWNLIHITPIKNTEIALKKIKYRAGMVFILVGRASISLPIINNKQ